MTRLDELNLLRFDNDIEIQVENKKVHQGIINCLQCMVDEEPILQRGLVGYLIVEHQNKIKECDIQIDYLQQERLKFKNNLQI